MESASCAIQERVGSISLRFRASEVHLTRSIDWARTLVYEKHSRPPRTLVNGWAPVLARGGHVRRHRRLLGGQHVEDYLQS